LSRDVDRKLKGVVEAIDEHLSGIKVSDSAEQPGMFWTGIVIVLSIMLYLAVAIILSIVTRSHLERIL
jgi:hypothetical protein